MTDPLGYFLGVPRFSWQVTEAEGKKQTAARIVITADEAGTRMLADTGMKEVFSVDMTIGELLERPRAKAALLKFMPQLTQIPDQMKKNASPHGAGAQRQERRSAGCH